MKYYSTRGDKAGLSASEAILAGIAPDGGLFIPASIPKPDKGLSALSRLDYVNLSYEIMKNYLTDFSEEELKEYLCSAYNTKFDDPGIAPVAAAGGAYFLELFHGPTLAFKDMALSLLPYLMKASAEKCGQNKEIIILTATSGDTGKAAMEGFKNVEGTRVFVFYPQGGVSPLQEMQMVTQEGGNVHAVAIEGNFDDAQTAVKALFADKTLEVELAAAGCVLSSANSINIGRLLPQIAYYYYGYFQMMTPGEIQEKTPFNVCVPTGNFGNILAAFYAREMGLPIQALLCASNENKVLFDFFRTGIYDKNRPLTVSTSPSMDIIISSNLERLLCHLSSSTAAVKSRMDSLDKTGKYEFDTKGSGFYGLCAAEEETFAAIKALYDETGYLIDTHTAVAYASYKKYVSETGDNTKTLIASTASPYKFTGDVLAAIDGKYAGKNPFALIDDMSALTGAPVPASARGLDKKPILHKDVCKKEALKDYLKHIICFQ